MIKYFRQKDIKLTIQPQDIQSLATMVAEIRDATSPRPVAGIHNFYYLVPTRPEYTAAIAKIINKYNMPAEQYMSLMYKGTPIIRIPKAQEILPVLHEMMKQIHAAQMQNVDTTFSKSDYDKLLNMMSHTCHARTVNNRGKEELFIYYLPRDAQYTAKALAIFQKYNLPVETHMSSLNNRAFPIIRVPLTPQSQEAFQKLQIVQEARSKRTGFQSGRENISKRLFDGIRDTMRRVFGGDKEK